MRHRGIKFVGGLPQHTDDIVQRYTLLEHWKDETLLRRFDHVATRHANKIAAIDARRSVSFSDLRKRTECLADAFQQLGVTKGTVVAAQLPNCIEAIETALACMRLGAIFCPISARLRNEIETILRITGAPILILPDDASKFNHLAHVSNIRHKLPSLRTVVITGKISSSGADDCFEALCANRQHVRPEVQTEANEPWLLEFTSGTTGEPKGVIRTHNNTLFSLNAFIHTYKAVRPHSNDVSLASLPISFIYPLYFSVLIALLNGLSIVLQDGSDPKETLGLIAKHKISLICTVPALIEGLMLELTTGAYDVSSLKNMFVGGDITSRKRREELARTFGCDVRDIYGLTECTLAVSTPPIDTDGNNIERTGLVCPGVEYKIVDQFGASVEAGMAGSLLLRGPSLMAGYYRNSVATGNAIDEDGWFKTGDLACEETKGHVRIVGRSKEVIIRGGVNISPQEIEEWLLLHPEVEQAGVYGLPDNVLGESIHASVVVTRFSRIDGEGLKGYLGNNIAKYKIPEQINIVENLPLSQTGKVLRGKLRERAIQAQNGS